MDNFKKLFEKEFHDYSKNTKEELQLLLKHHKEDLKEYQAEGQDQDNIDHIKYDIKEIQDALSKV